MCPQKCWVPHVDWASRFPTFNLHSIRQDKYNGVPLTVAPVPRWGFYLSLAVAPVPLAGAVCLRPKKSTASDCF